MLLEGDSQRYSDSYNQIEVMKQDSLSAINEIAALCDRGSVATEHQLNYGKKK